MTTSPCTSGHHAGPFSYAGYQPGIGDVAVRHVLTGA